MNRAHTAFTLLEIIIVVIVLGVLAGLALPKLVSTVEVARSSEAMAAFSIIRKSMERCYVKVGNYGNCESFSDLDIENPQNSPGAHFTYLVSNGDTEGYIITATRNTVDDGDNSSEIILTQTSNSVSKSGTGVFSDI